MATRAKKIPANEIVKIKNQLEKRFDVKITSNKNSEDVKAIASILDILGIKNKDAFLKEVSITINNHVYLCFEPGCSTIDPILQLEIIAHELLHTMQWEENPVKFSLNYLGKHEKRAEYETEALSCNMELHYRLTKQLYAPKDLSKHLVWYKCSSSDIRVAEKHLAILANIFKHGGNYNLPVKAIMELI